MIRLAALLCIFAAPVSADVMHGGYGSRMSLLPADEPCFAVVEIENRYGTYNKTENLETSEGVVAIKYTTIGGHNATDHDLVAVVTLPPHVIAAPPEMGIPDGDVGRICLMKWIGG